MAKDWNASGLSLYASFDLFLILYMVVDRFASGGTENFKDFS